MSRLLEFGRTKTAKKGNISELPVSTGEVKNLFVHGQTYTDGENVYKAYVKDRLTTLKDLNGSSLWLDGWGRKVGFIEGYFLWTGKPLMYGQYDVTADGIKWWIKPYPSGDISNFHPCTVVEKIIKLTY